MTPEQAIDGYLEMLHAHLDGVGYPARAPVELSLDIDRDELREMSPTELAELAFELSNASFAVQDEYNRQKTKAERCRTILTKLVGEDLDRSIYNTDDRWMTAAFENPRARPYWEIRQNALTVCLRLESQSMRLAELSKCITNINYSRR